MYLGHLTANLEPEGVGLTWYRPTSVVVLGTWEAGHLNGRALYVDLANKTAR